MSSSLSRPAFFVTRRFYRYPSTLMAGQLNPQGNRIRTWLHRLSCKSAEKMRDGMGRGEAPTHSRTNQIRRF